MYIPDAFKQTDLAVLHRTIREFPFATLITTSGDGTLSITHLPTLLDANRGDRGTIVSHVARSNPHAELLAAAKPTVAVFHGPHAYISPAWYRTSPSVPTWNYVAVHVSGIPRVLTAEADVHEVLRNTTAHFEPTGSGYQVDLLPSAYFVQLAKAVVAFEMPIDRIEGKFKLSQNRSAEDRQGVTAGLASGDADSRKVVDAMRAVAGP